MAEKEIEKIDLLKEVVSTLENWLCIPSYEWPKGTDYRDIALRTMDSANKSGLPSIEIARAYMRVTILSVEKKRDREQMDDDEFNRIKGIDLYRTFYDIFTNDVLTPQELVQIQEEFDFKDYKPRGKWDPR